MTNKDKEFINKKFGHLTVIKKGPSYVSPGGHSSTQWWCECDCPEHKLILVRRNNLVSGNTKSCGCQNNKSRKINIQKAIDKCKLDLTNKTFGKLKAIKPTNERKGNSIVWECQCECGNIVYLPANELNANRYFSCGCLKESKGISKIKQLLKENNINYITEKTFENCRFPDTKEKARFDFFIDNNYLLEFDGIQHYEERDKEYFRDSLEKRQAHDKFKDKWCKENNIILKRIPYYALQQLTIDDIIGDKYIL